MTESRYPYVHVEVPASAAELVSDELWSLGASGVEERDASTLIQGGEAGVTLVASFADEGQAARVVAHFGARHEARVEVVVGDAWAHAWRDYFKPTRIGRRLVIRPSWEEVDPRPGEVVLTIDPGNAFGSGIHETTRLCLREVDRRVRDGDRVLDVGCGSGVLSVAALLLGADRARAVDVDPDAVRVSIENARINRVVSRLRVSTTPIERLRGEYDLVLANIQAHVLIPMAEDLMARTAKTGTLVLSGVLAEAREEVLAAFAPMKRRLVAREGEWVALILKR